VKLHFVVSVDFFALDFDSYFPWSRESVFVFLSSSSRRSPTVSVDQLHQFLPLCRRNRRNHQVEVLLLLR